MDYQKLSTILPKAPIKWTIEDIQLWLNFIGLDSLYPVFKNSAIDGSCLSCLTEDDLKNQLGVKSGIIVKKLMAWIKMGMREYQDYLKNRFFSINNQSIIPVNNPGLIKNISIKENKENPQKKIIKIEEEKKGPTYSIPTLEKRQVAQPTIENTQTHQLIIQQYDSPQASFYSLKAEGGKIGRHSSNSILILEQSISRFHAQIEYQQGNYFIKDIGSTTGTFIKLVDKFQVFQGTIIQMGSNQFIVAKLEFNLITLMITQGPNLHQQLLVELKKNKASIGRKPTNEISFPDDQHLSNTHACFLIIDNKYFIQDMATTNGTWLRLSIQSQPSQRFRLNNNTVFKIGANLTYQCRLGNDKMLSEQVSVSSENACAICYTNDKDCVYMPCKHNAACVKCSKNIKECPICRIKIQDFIRIYRS